MARKPVTDISAWPSLTLEGNLVAPAMIASIDLRQACEQKEEDYRIRKGLTIRDEISTAFRVGQSHFDTFAKLKSPSVEATRRFVRGFLAETFGFDDLARADGVISFLAGGRVPIVVVPPSDEKLDRRSVTLSTDRSRSPAFALQDYLNDSGDALWGLVTNGAVIRLMRDNASLTRPAYIEADLVQIFTNDDAASFAVLWSLIHRTRFGIAGTPVTDCTLERWRETGSREGEAVRDRLADQVETALKALGSGFLEANPDLAARLKSGEVNLTEWFNELLRFVYRLIFLMVAEDRNLLHPETAKPEVRKLYAEGYSLGALPDEAYKPLTGDDKELARRYARLNREQRDRAKGHPQLFKNWSPPEILAERDHKLKEMAQDDLASVEAKAQGFESIRASDDWQRLKTASDLYISANFYMAAFFTPKATGEAGLDAMPLTEHVWQAASGQVPAEHLREGATLTSEKVNAFHWFIEFPEIMERDRGFDIVIGNPPWERIKLEEQEFFATRSPAIAGAPNKAERQKLIDVLEEADPDSADGRLWQDFVFAKRTAEAASEFARLIFPQKSRQG